MAYKITNIPKHVKRLQKGKNDCGVSFLTFLPSVGMEQGAKRFEHFVFIQ